MSSDMGLMPRRIEELKVRSLEEIQGILRDSTHSLIDRIAAVFIIFGSPLPAPEKVRILTEVLHDPNQTLRSCVIYHLGQLGCTEVVGTLRRFITDECEDVQFETLRALALAGNREIIEPCAQLIAHGNSDQKAGAIIALGFLRCGDSLRVLEDLWTSQELSWEERVVLALSLARNGNRLGEDFLEQELESDDEWRISIAAALAGLENRTGLREVRRLLDELEKPRRLSLEGLLLDHLEGKPEVDVHDRRAVLAWVDAKLAGWENAPK